MNGIVLAGYYGFGNFGDELLLKAFIQRFRSLSAVGRIYVLAPKRGIHTSYHAVNRTDIVGIIHALLNSRALVFGGGGIFQDATSSLSLYYYLILIIIACALRRKIILAFQGIGPVHNRFNAWLFTFITKHCADYVSVRDHDSLLILRKLGLNTPVHQYADPALNAISAASVHESVNAARKVLGVNVRFNPSHPDKRSFRLLTQTLGKVAREHDLLLRFFVLQDSEEELIEYIRSHIGYPHIEAVRVSVENYRKTVACDWLLSMRLHLLMLAYVWNIPLLGLAYDIKVRSFLRSVGAPYVGVKFKGLRAKLDYLITTTRQEQSDEHDQILKQISDSIEKGFDDIEEVLEGRIDVA